MTVFQRKTVLKSGLNITRTIWVSCLDMVFADAATMTNPAKTYTRTPTFAPLRWAKRAPTRNINPVT